MNTCYSIQRLIWTDVNTDQHWWNLQNRKQQPAVTLDVTRTHFGSVLSPWRFSFLSTSKCLLGSCCSDFPFRCGCCIDRRWQIDLSNDRSSSVSRIRSDGRRAAVRVCLRDFREIPVRKQNLCATCSHVCESESKVARREQQHFKMIEDQSLKGGVFSSFHDDESDRVCFSTVNSFTGDRTEAASGIPIIQTLITSHLNAPERTAFTDSPCADHCNYCQCMVTGDRTRVTSTCGSTNRRFYFFFLID